MNLMQRVAWILFLFFGAAIAGEPATREVFTQQPTVKQNDSKTLVAFAVSQKTDVEVAILNAKGEVVRHLAAGVLGGDVPPPPPLKAGFTQSLEWDGTDDYGQSVAGASVRVRCGMGVKLETIVGGDPYAFWSTQSAMCQDHAEWKMTGIEVKSDGQVYVIGTQTSFGSPVLRAYDARGNYVRTVFPPPAGKPVDEMKGWNVNLRADGTWALPTSYAGCRVSNWGLMAGGVDWGRTTVARFIPSAETHTLHLADGNQEMIVGTDGSQHQFAPAPVLKGEPLPKTGCTYFPYESLAPDGKSLYISGIGTQTPGFWREAQVWKVDLATRVPAPFFALKDEELKDRAASGNANGTPFAAFHGVAVDSEGRVFIADRQSKRIAVVTPDGKLLRSLPVEYPEAVAVSPKSKAVYITTRLTSWGQGAFLRLVKFNDWSKDKASAVTIPLLGAEIHLYGGPSRIAVVQDKDDTLIWVAHTYLPVRVYKDSGAGLELVKDFYESGSKQRALDMQAMEVDRTTGDAYIADTQSFLFRIRDWKNPVFEPCLVDANTRIKSGSIAIDSRSRQLYTKAHYAQPIRRWNMDGDFFTPVNNDGSSTVKRQTNSTDEFCSPGDNPYLKITKKDSDFLNGVITPITCSWVFTGLWERGMAACPAGAATLGVVMENGARIDDYSGPITYFHPDKQVPWPGLHFTYPSPQPNTGGIRFDPHGNLYVGISDGKAFDVAPGFERDRDYAKLGRICKFAPTGSMQSGNLFPTDPAAPAKIYAVHYGPIVSPGRFGVDEYGRIYYPNGVEKTVGVIDNEGNQVLSFGTYGNRDSMGGLPGDLVPTKDIPMAWPTSVDATDDYIYVSDRQNVRLMRLAKTFAASASVAIK